MWQHSHSFRSLSFRANPAVVIGSQSFIPFIVRSVPLLCITYTPATPFGPTLLSLFRSVAILFTFLWSTWAAVASIHERFVYFLFTFFRFSFLGWALFFAVFFFVRRYRRSAKNTRNSERPGKKWEMSMSSGMLLAPEYFKLFSRRKNQVAILFWPTRLPTVRIRATGFLFS